MQRLIQRTIHYFSRFTAAGASVSMAGLFLIVFINSLRRYTLGKSLEWGEELPVFITIYGVMFGIAWAYLQDRHIRFALLIKFLSEAMITKLYVLVDLIMVVNGAMLTLSGWMFVIRRGRYEASGMINLAKSLRDLTGWDSLIWFGHLYPYQAAMTLGGVLLTLAALFKLLQRINAARASEPIEG